MQGFCDDVYRTLSTGQKVFQGHETRKYYVILHVVVVDCGKNYKHGLSEVRLFNKATYHQRVGFIAQHRYNFLYLDTPPPPHQQNIKILDVS